MKRSRLAAAAVVMTSSHMGRGVLARYDPENCRHGISYLGRKPSLERQAGRRCLTYSFRFPTNVVLDADQKMLLAVDLARGSSHSLFERPKLAGEGALAKTSSTARFLPTLADLDRSGMIVVGA